MTLLTAWVVFPLVLGVLSLGCGLLLEQAAGVELPGPLLLPAGFAVVSLAAQMAILFGPTVQFATPAVIALAVAGFGLALPLPRKRLDGWAAAAAGAVYCVFAAPIVLSGRATFAGYIKLDDTATYLAMLDRAMQHGYNVAGLAPSTYQATLDTSLALWLPARVAASARGRACARPGERRVAWQPYLTVLAALLALCLYQLVAGIVRSPRLRAAVAFIGAQAALIYGYALWGGVKELAAAVLVALARRAGAGRGEGLLQPRRSPRAARGNPARGHGRDVRRSQRRWTVWLLPLLGGQSCSLRSLGLWKTLALSSPSCRGALAIPSLLGRRHLALPHGRVHRRERIRESPREGSTGSRSSGSGRAATSACRRQGSTSRTSWSP